MGKALQERLPVLARQTPRKITARKFDWVGPRVGAEKVPDPVPVEADDIVIRAAVFEHATSLCLDAVFNVLADRLKLDLQAYRERHANLE